MANHVIYDTLWASRRLRRCTREAAMAYPWIFLVADDHGRFEFDPRGIWSRCFAAREDVSLDDVVRWLSEYEREGLLIRYHHDGAYAYWYRFRGRRPSERRPSQCPDPAQFNGRGKAAAASRKRRDDGAGTSRRDRDKSTPEIEVDQEIEQIGAGAESAAPSSSGNGSERLTEPIIDQRPDVVVENAIRKALRADQRELLVAVGTIATRTGRAPPDVMREVTAYKRPDGSVADGKINPAALSPERLGKSLADARAWLADLEKT